MKVQKIKFKEQEFILSSPKANDSPITTVKTFQNGECSYAHLYRDNGKVMRFHKQIGTIDDIEFGEFIEIEIHEAEFVNGILGQSWPWG